MLKNYLKVAFRSLRRRPIYGVINVGGLAMGLACCVLLAAFVQYEWTFDRFHEHADRLYRVVTAERTGGAPAADGAAGGADTTFVSVAAAERQARTPAPLGPALVAALPEVEAAVRVIKLGARLRPAAAAGGGFEAEVLAADPGLFRHFSFPARIGDPIAALAEPNGAVLTAAAAARFFGGAAPAEVLGRPLLVAFDHDTVEVAVSAVVADAPAASSLPFEVVLPFDYAEQAFAPSPMRDFLMRGWDIGIVETYVRLRPGAAAAVAEKLPAFVDAHYGRSAPIKALALQPLPAIHLDQTVTGGLVPASNPAYSYVLAALAAFVLLIACINFATLALGRSVERAREVGVRKAVGARRGQVRAQFWGEAALTSTVALVLGVALAQLLLPAFSSLVGLPSQLSLFGGLAPWAVLTGLVALTAVLAGAYPALVFARFEPVAVLKGGGAVRGRAWLPRALVVAQFALSIALMGSALVMARQVGYLTSKDLGFEPTARVVVRLGDGDSRAGSVQLATLKEEAARLPAVRHVAGVMFAPGQDGLPLQVDGPEGTALDVRANLVDRATVDALGLALTSGRVPEEGSTGVLVNEAFVRALGWEDPLGRPVPFAEGRSFGRAFGGSVVTGVVADYHLGSLHEPVPPVVLAPRSRMGGGATAAIVHLDAPAAEALTDLEAVWARVAPGTPFDYTFLNDVVADWHAEERRWQTLVQTAAGVALLIACLGLFGLATLAAARRRKEVGIRKVLGASIPDVVVLLARDFAVLVVVGFVLGTPAAFIAGRRWLDAFAYRIELGPGLFLLAGGLALALAVLTVSVQAVRAARRNPVESLRYE